MFGSEDRRSQILEAATKLFGEKGFHHTTVEEIAVLAGVGKGTVYEYFPSKKDVLRDLLVMAIEYYFNLFPLEEEGKLNLREKIENMTQLHFQFFLKHSDIARIFLFEHRQITEGLDSIMMEREQKRIDYVAGLLDEGIRQGEIRIVDCQLAAKVISGALWNMGMDLIISTSSVNDEELVNGVVDILWRGLKS